MHKNIALDLPSIQRLNEAFSYDHKSMDFSGFGKQLQRYEKKTGTLLSMR